MGLKERHHLVIEQLRRSERGLAVRELGKAYLGVSINEGLLVAPAYTLERPDVERILRATLPWTFTLKFPVGFLVPCRRLQGRQLRLGQNMALLRPFGL